MGGHSVEGGQCQDRKCEFKIRLPIVYVHEIETVNYYEYKRSLGVTLY